MNGFHYSRPYNQDELQRLSNQDNGPQMMGMMDPEAVEGSIGIPGAQSLDDIVNENEQEMRRRSMPMAYGNSPNELDATMRRVSMMGMMEFGGGPSSSRGLEGYQFDPSTTGFDSSMSGMSGMPGGMSGQNENSHGRRSSNAGLSISTHFPNRSYNNMGQQDSMYASPLQVNTSMDMSLHSPFITSGLPSGMSMSMDMAMMGSDLPTTDMYGSAQYGSPYGESSPIHQQYTPSVLAPTPQDSATATLRTDSLSHSHENGATPDTSHLTSRSNSHEKPSSTSRAGSASTQAGSMGPPNQVARSYSPKPLPRNTGPPESINGNILPWAPPADGWPSTMTGRPHTETKYKDAYAPSGYNFLAILTQVMSRPNPVINIGSVDLSCAFVVCNAREHDKPIEYCSDSFERLTGYTRHEILGQNCRFLQAPSGKVEQGVQRKYCDDKSVFYLKKCINDIEEAQISLINYRKGGQPFMNLLTMIPLRDDNNVLTHFIGFQVDLVENPNAINSRNPDGSLSIAYQRGANLPSYFLTPPEASIMTEFVNGQTIGRDEVSSVLATMSNGDNELSRRLMDKVLLENADDVIHVLSLKGIFLYLSQSCRKILEYEPSELVGTPLSAVCHPSDIVPVTRELKDGSNGSPVNVVFRIRRKASGYVWFESHGSLLSDQGKGRKCVILVGRERPVYTLSKTVLAQGGGIGDNELWAKMSTTGMFLYVSSNVRQLLDRHPEELVGTNIQSLMRQESKEEFGRMLRLALQGKNTSVRHEMTNKRGQVLQVYTWIYPGDATEGQKPTFLLAQVRLIRYHRGGGQKSTGNSRPSDLSGSVPSSASMLTGQNGGSTPMSVATTGTADTSKYRTGDGHPVSMAGQDGLVLGNQDETLASEENVFDELKTTRSTSWQFELRQMERRNRVLAEEVQTLLASKKKRKRRKGAGALQKDCVNCHTKHTPEWRRGPSGQRDLCNSCGLRWAKQNGRVSPRNSQKDAKSAKSAPSDKASKASASPMSGQSGGNTGANIPPTSPAEKRASAQEASMISHAAKVARMEAPATHGRSSGIPTKINEDVEP